METKTNISVQYEAPLGYCIEDIRPNGGIQKFRSAAYSDVSVFENFIIIYLSRLLIYWI